MPQPNQIHLRREDVVVTAEDLLSLKGATGAVTEKVLGRVVARGAEWRAQGWLRGVEPEFRCGAAEGTPLLLLRGAIVPWCSDGAGAWMVEHGGML